MKKIYILDTSSIISYPNAISFLSNERNIIIIPAAVVKELDKHKIKDGDIGINARKSVRALMSILAERSSDNLDKSKFSKLGKFYSYSSKSHTILFSHFSSSGGFNGDDGILFEIENIVLSNSKINKKHEITLVSEDNLLKIRAMSLGVKVLSIFDIVENHEISKGKQELYGEASDFKLNNLKPIVVEAEENKLMEILSNGRVETSDMSNFKIPPNAWVKINNKSDDLKLSLHGYSDLNSKYIKIFSGHGFSESGIKLTKSEDKVLNGHEAFGLKPLNECQKLALAFLLDDRIPLVTIEGGAATGKTILAMAAGLERTISYNKFDKLIYSRPTIALGQQMGFLPGEISNKMAPWIAPLRDNVSALFSKSTQRKVSDDESSQEISRGKGNKYDHDKYLMMTENQNNKSLTGLGELEKQGLVEIEALQFIRGRSLPRQFFIVDEAQNLTRHEVKTILTRAGEGTKIILIGDPDQIDVPGLTKEKCGLVLAREAFSGSNYSAHVKLIDGVRSGLATEAAKRL